VRLALVSLALAGCSSILGIEDLSGPGGANPDGGGRVDAAPGARRIEGILTTFGVMGTDQIQPNTPIAFVPQIAGEPELSGITGDDGRYSFDYGEDTRPMQGFLRTNHTPASFTVSYPPPFIAPIAFDPRMFTDSLIQDLASQSGTNANPQADFFVVLVTDAEGKPRRDMSVQLDVAVAQEFYATVDGRIDPMLLQTTDAGLAFAFNIPNNAARLVTVIQNGNVVGERDLAVVGKAGTRSFVVVVVP
jgi:hypothetical protein